MLLILLLGSRGIASLQGMMQFMPYPALIGLEN